MAWKHIFRPSNRRARLLVGLILVMLFCVQCTTEAFRQSDFVIAISGKPVGQNSSEVLQKVDGLAKSDHVGLLKFCLAHYDSQYRDYTCTLIKQEKISGAVGKEQRIHVKFKESPFSVAMAWTPETAPLGDRSIYVEGKYGNKMLVRPKGVWNDLLGTVVKATDDPMAMKNTLRPINKFGFKHSLESLLEVYEQAKRCGDLKESFGGYAQVCDGRKAVVLIRHLPAGKEYPAVKTVTYIDMEYLLPIGVEGYDENEQLLCRYFFKDLKFNVGLDENAFLPQANDMKPPKL